MKTKRTFNSIEEAQEEMWSRFRLPDEPVLPEPKKPTRKELGLKRGEKCKWEYSDFQIEARGWSANWSSTDLGVNGTAYHPDQEPMPIFLYLTSYEREEYFSLLRRIQSRIQHSVQRYDESDETTWYSAENPMPVETDKKGPPK